MPTTLNRRALLASAAALALAGARPAAASAAPAFPGRPVRIIVGNSAGSGADIAVRTVARRLHEVWRHPVAVENRGGAGGLLAAEAVAQAEPDGHTLSLSQEGAIAIAPLLQPGLRFDPRRDLAPVVHLADVDYVLVAHPATGFRTLPELVAGARSRPGRYSYASAGIGSVHHLSFEMLKDAGNFSFVHIPYRGGSAGLVDVVAGQVHAMFVSVAAALPHIRAGRVNALAIGGAKRHPLLPELPRVADFFPGVYSGTWFALFAPVRTPSSVVDQIASDTTEAVRHPEVAEALARQGIVPVGGTPADLRALVERDAVRFAKQAASVQLAAN